MWTTVLQFVNEGIEVNDKKYDILLDLQEGNLLYLNEQRYEVVNVIYFLDKLTKVVVVRIC